MLTHFQDWFAFVKGINPGFGIPFVLVGLTLMFMGLQFHRTAVPFILFLVGLAIGLATSDDPATQFGVGGGVGVVLALVGTVAFRPAVAALGGFIGACALLAYIGLLGVQMQPLIGLAIGVLGFIAGGALAFIVHRETVILITSIMGSLLLVSGLNPVMLEALPSFYRTVTSFLEDYPGFFVPFLFGGPTLIATLVQMAQANAAGEGKA